MTPERLAEIKALLQRPDSRTTSGGRVMHDLMAEVERLRARLAELEAEKERAALDAFGDALDKGL